ncbi:MAG TPA: DNA recombination protein RmuC [Nocardioides sp.]|uniref:DNA recombination protein RmuC n=1 Tax=uncultured Nocardioides sp. TaxID=198441 RepID=UPI000ECED87D|nr:DNA recombination protein RmuC [uncultured Nocardioides sp.]HCB05434.1 DNA recombination protein RmuC [Nocardioides sp.]HRD59761.1 DNA recombination protein RmuC [Nocardioides sp.]HRI94674.1 DNA recombination protein RmuC [Nocardioides sp.]HRK44323.1 DNA recombination protein RmuC [Nocardioides sp.]
MDTISLLAVLALGLMLGLVLGALVGVLWARSRPPYAGSFRPPSTDQAELVLGLDRLSDQMRDLEHQRATWQGQLHEQVQDMRRSTETLRRETQSLSTALRKPQVRGRWGELHLRRAVELAGLVDRCDFTEQPRLDDGARRPDLVVRLVGDRSVVVDAKVPLDAYLDATSTDDDNLRAGHLARHARQVRTHVDLLAGKAYWRSLDETPEFVVLFLPAESFLAAALEADPGLLEHAADRQVVLATPTTLIALLRTVAHGWSHEVLADQAREIHRLGRELHGRLGTLVGHLDHLGRSLNTAVGHYNQTVGSLESRVLVAARRFQDLAVTDDELPRPRSVELHAVERRGSDDGPPGGRTVAV